MNRKMRKKDYLLFSRGNIFLKMSTRDVVHENRKIDSKTEDGLGWFRMIIPHFLTACFRHAAFPIGVATFMRQYLIFPFWTMSRGRVIK